MTPKDAQYLDDMVKKVKQINYQNEKEEKDFLIKHNAMKEDGTVIAEYPKLFYIVGGEKKSHDEGGNMLGLKTKQEQLQKEGKNCWIDYVPRFYTFYLKAKKHLETNQ